MIKRAAYLNGILAGQGAILIQFDQDAIAQTSLQRKPGAELPSPAKDIGVKVLYRSRRSLSILRALASPRLIQGGGILSMTIADFYFTNDFPVYTGNYMCRFQLPLR